MPASLKDCISIQTFALKYARTAFYHQYGNTDLLDNKTPVDSGAAWHSFMEQLNASPTTVQRQLKEEQDALIFFTKTYQQIIEIILSAVLAQQLTPRDPDTLLPLGVRYNGKAFIKHLLHREELKAWFLNYQHINLSFGDHEGVDDVKKPTQQTLPDPATHSALCQESSQPGVNATLPDLPQREHELHEVIKTTYEKLKEEYGRKPRNTEVWKAIMNTAYDCHELIQEITNTVIEWKDWKGNARSMKRTTFNNFISALEAKIK